MPDPIFSDNALKTAKFALDGLAKRQEIIGNNLANVDTPGYQSQTLNFEDALQQRLGHSEHLPLAATHTGHLGERGEGISGMRMEARNSGAWRADGNDVDVDIELNQMAETGIRYQAMTQLVSKKLMLLKSIASSQ